MNDGFGKYDTYSVSGSIYCYKDSCVLKNRFGLRDAQKLRDLESDISAIRQNDLLTNPIRGHFTVNHLCRIHRYLLGDLYPFAGHFRKEDIMKGNTRFLSHRDIKAKLTALLTELAVENYLQGSAANTLIARSAYYLAELNYIHPFREGNGRSTREFMRQLYDLNGYTVNWASVPTAELLSAMEISVYETSPLKAVLRRCLAKTELPEI